ncbi:sigma 54-interacting transcriptional regulator [Treponema pedis]|uniref:sigma 54-interacting transcriptional regulator n=1 Tax=Treponema pedis TaxID=409322 RepID=UPI00042A5FED|nr:sigma 54-interacting transcriptional regulator [Treponema pedis]
MRTCIYSAYSKKDVEMLLSQTHDIWDLQVTYNSGAIFEFLEKIKCDFLLFDVETGGMFPLEALDKLKNYFPMLNVFLIVHGGAEILKLQFSKYLISGIFDLPQDFLFIKQYIENFFSDKESRKNQTVLMNMDKDTADIINSNIIGKSRAAAALKEFIVKASKNDFPVLLLGETGCGKGLVAELIHKLSAFKTKKFMPINVGCIPENLAESFLFGTEKGSFTDAETKDGIFAAANGGTIFLDEMESLSPAVQAKLLHVLETKAFCPVGSMNIKKTDFRLICASNENLRELIKKKLFRRDLYYRLDVLRYEIPPLRKRKEDIALLVNYYLKSTGKRISASAMEKLYLNNWHGNIRELKNCLNRACCKASDTDIITALHIEF